MTEKNQQNELHKEFELERMILFSDAVFAIAITLLIIEIKFPEIHQDEYTSLLHTFKPVLLEGAAFLISFCFIGVSWVTHLHLFRHLRAYDSGVIVRNLITLFFIVTFPFSASSLTHFKPGFPLPILIYFANVMLIFISNFLLAQYMFKTKPELTMPGNDADKNYLYRRNKLMAIVFPIGFLIVLITSIVTHNDQKSVDISLYVATLMFVAVNRWIKKMKPKKQNGHPVEAPESSPS